MHDIDALFNQALQLQQAGKVQEAIGLYQEILKQEDHAGAYANLGVALRTQGHIQAAIAVYRKSLAIQKDQVSVLSNLGGALRALGQLDEAILCLEQALQIDSECVAAHYNLGLAIMDAREPEKALQYFEKVLELDPNHVEAAFDRSTCILQMGNLEQGFQLYESRFQYEKRLIKPYKQPVWDGSPLKGKTLLLCAEQGFGDTLMFCRYIPLIEKHGGKIILECPTELKRLMETLEGIDQVICPGDKLPAFDTYLSLLSLPRLFKTSVDTIPREIPYLQAPKAQHSLSMPSSTQLKVGIVWGVGHPDVVARNRSIELKHFLALSELPNVSLYSLQKGPQAKQLQELGCSTFIQDLGNQLRDFADTAAVLQELDLLITADTSIVHLAGALGKPVWVLLPSCSEWRWMLDREDSPWYPTVKLFRQATSGDWSSVFARVCQEFQKTIKVVAPG